jgi:dTMP kinase
MAKAGLFLVLEGLDGTGKSTQAKRLVERVGASGRRVVHLREPGGTPAGERIREILLDPASGDLDAVTEVFLYQAARRRLVLERLVPALAEGAVVVCERWHTATAAYQGAGGGADPDLVLRTSAAATGGVEPRRSLLLALPRGVAAVRRADRPPDRIEARDDAYRARVERAFRSIFSGDPDRFRVVDAEGAPDEVAARLWEAVRDLV